MDYDISFRYLFSSQTHTKKKKIHLISTLVCFRSHPACTDAQCTVVKNTEQNKPRDMLNLDNINNLGYTICSKYSF